MKNKATKACLIVSIALIAIVIYGLQNSQPDFIEAQSVKSHGLPPVESMATKTSLASVNDRFLEEKMVFRANYNKLNNLELQSVLVKGEGNHVFLVYDESKDATVANAELVIEIVPIDQLMFDPELNKEYITTINGYTAYVNEKAGCGWDEYVAKYGPYSTVVDILIEDNNYWIRAAPTMSLEEVMEIANKLTK